MAIFLAIMFMVLLCGFVYIAAHSFLLTVGFSDEWQIFLSRNTNQLNKPLDYGKMQTGLSPNL
jgi:hypothetical protein